MKPCIHCRRSEALYRYQLCHLCYFTPDVHKHYRLLANAEQPDAGQPDTDRAIDLTDGLAELDDQYVGCDLTIGSQPTALTVSYDQALEVKPATAMPAADRPFAHVDCLRHSTAYFVAFGAVAFQYPHVYRLEHRYLSEAALLSLVEEADGQLIVQSCRFDPAAVDFSIHFALLNQPAAVVLDF